MKTEVWYHAGVRAGDHFRWSAHSRRTRERAEGEARRMARAGGTPIVECWPGALGPRPGDCEAVTASWVVE